MAKENEKKNLKKSQDLRDKSSLLSYGVDTTLDDEDREVRAIIQKTITDTKEKLGERTNGTPINYFNEINFGRAFSELFVNGNKKEKDETSKNFENNQNFKKMMETDTVDFGALLMEEKTRSILFSNYKIIQKHIPECANALNVYVDNIISPDDYSKLIFNINYEKGTDDETAAVVKEKIDDLTLKYELEDRSTEIIKEALLLGHSYQAVLSIEDELQYMLNNNGVLNEAAFNKAILADTDAISHTILSENVKATDIEVEALNECFGSNMSKTDVDVLVANLVNNNVTIGSTIELLEERAIYEKAANEEMLLEKDMTGVDIPRSYY